MIGVALVFASAVTYAIFISLSAGFVQRIGAWRFTGITVGFSCLFILAHHFVARSPSTLFELPSAVYLHGVWLAIFGTVIPSFLLGIGLRRAGAQKFAVVGTVGPVATFLLAWAVLGESPNAAQLLGFGLSLGGGLWVTLRKEVG